MSIQIALGQTKQVDKSDSDNDFMYVSQEEVDRLEQMKMTKL